MSRKLFLSALGLLCAAVLTGCGNNIHSNSIKASGEDENRLDIVCTVFPGYDWVRNILGEHENEVNLTYLLSNGNDMHSFQPSAEDIIKISSCDIFLYTGGESEYWVDDVLENAVNKNMRIINLIDILGSSAVEEELKEGMQSDEDCDEDKEYDEHTWLSLKNAEIFCDEIENALSAADPENSADYENNLNKYKSGLESLDEKFTVLFENMQEKTLIFADRFPFRYFTEDYGLDYYAAFLGCSADIEASFETVAFLSGKIDELGCNAVFELESSDGSVARAVVDNCKNKNCDMVKLNSIQSVRKKDIQDGTNYLSLMNENYNLIKEHLS